MHFVTSWDIPTTVDREAATTQLVAAFGQNRFMRVLTTFYIVQVPSQVEYATIKSNLQNVGRSLTSDFRLIISPLMTGGNYDGLHVTEVWQKINQLSA